MTFVALEAMQGLHGGSQGFDGLIHGQIATVMSSQNAGQPETDIGRTGAHGHSFLMAELIIIRGEPGGFSRYKSCKVMPGSPGNLPEKTAVLFCQRFNRLCGQRQIKQPTEQR